MNIKVKMILIAYIDAFVAVLPFIMILAVSVLFSALFNLEALSYLASSLTDAFPLILLLSISNQLAKRYEVSQFISVITAISIYTSNESLSHTLFDIANLFYADPSILVLIVPILTVKCLSILNLKSQKYLKVGERLNESVKYSYSAVLTYLVVTILLSVTNYIVLRFINIEFFSTAFLSDIQTSILWIFAEHLLWFLGLHGQNFMSLTFGTEFLNQNIFDNMTYKQFIDLFIINGGSGAGLSLLLAIFIRAKDKEKRDIAKLATPFVIFNINEILIFGIPIIFNRCLIIPFLLVPLMNFAISYSVLLFLPIEVVDNNIPWITPIFLDAFLSTDSQIISILLQLFLLVADIILYLPFVAWYSNQQSFTWHNTNLSKNLGLAMQLESKKDLKSYWIKQDIIRSNTELSKVIKLLNNQSLMVYYQPKINIVDNTYTHCEALLRIKMPDGTVSGPYFLKYIEDAGLSAIIDVWVCKQVHKDISLWKRNNIHKTVSINLHPDTLANDNAITQIIDILYGEDVDFEIIERSFIEKQSCINNVKLLKESGFSISIDDFGTGYSSFETICSLPVDTLKIDKSIIDLILTPEGFYICKLVSEFCEDMNFTCVAEGVETEEQYNEISNFNIKYIQGYYYSPALPPKEASEYNLAER